VLVQRYSRHPLVLPGVILLGIGSFFGGLSLTTLTMDRAVAQWWLFEPFANQMIWTSYSFRMFQDVNWMVLVRESIHIIEIILVSMLALLFSATGIESVIEKEIDLEQD
jgi:hypothetical protein